jgi:hypothetical protein
MLDVLRALSQQERWQFDRVIHEAATDCVFNGEAHLICISSTAHENVYRCLRCSYVAKISAHGGEGIHYTEI